MLRTRLHYRANGAEDSSPGQRSGDPAQVTLSALKRRRIPAPFQGAPNRWIPRPRALPWATLRRRFQRRRSRFHG